MLARRSTVVESSKFDRQGHPVPDSCGPSMKQGRKELYEVWVKQFEGIQVSMLMRADMHPLPAQVIVSEYCGPAW
jgi:hypothetical protein